MKPNLIQQKKFIVFGVLSLISAICLFTILSIENNDELKKQGKLFEELALMNPEEIAKLPKRTGIDQAMLQDFMKTRDLILGYVPSERKISAYQEAKKIIDKKKLERGLAIPNVSWVERGPNNLGGRTRALMFDPNDLNNKKVWAAGVSGGLWYTNDITTNEKWTAVDDFMSNLAISSLTHDQNNPNIFYMGTGEGWFNGGAVRGAGIWKSIDGGTNWEQLVSTKTSDFYYVQKIVVLNDGSVLAATHSGILKSVDGGTSWTRVLAGKRAADIELSSNGTIYASMGIFEAGLLYKSTDDGENWLNITPAEGGQRIEIAVAHSNPNVVYAVASSSTNSASWLYKSLNGGESWTGVSIPKMVDGTNNDFTRGQAWYDLILVVYPDDPNKVIVGGIDLHLSTDGGQTWLGISHWYGGFGRPYVHADQHAISFRPGTNNEAVFGNDGGVFYSSNLEQPQPQFDHTVNGYNVTQFYSCAISNNLSNIFLAGAQDNGSHFFQSDGMNSTTEVTGGDGAFCFISQNNPNIMITSYVFNNYYVSKDGGSTFADLPGNENNVGEFINPAEFDSKSNTLFTTHQTNQIRRVSNVGGNGTSNTILNVNIGNGKASALKSSPNNDNRLYIGTNTGKVYRIDNTHLTPIVTDISNGLIGANISSIDIGSSDNNILVTISNYGAISVYESIDGGQTWQNKESNLPDIPVRWGLYNPNDNKEVLIATEVGVWATANISDVNPIWEPAVEGLANVRCDMLKYRASDGLVAIATYGRGLFTTNVFEPNTRPIASFGVDKTIVYSGATLSFTDYSSFPEESWNWSFGDGQTSTTQNPTHTYNEPGIYEVKLMIANGAAEKTVSNYIQVLPNKEANYTLADGGDFETNPLDFGVMHLGGTSFERGKSTVFKKSGTASGDFAWVTGVTDTKYADWTETYLLSPNFLFGETPKQLKFKTKFGLEKDWDGFIVEFSKDKGETWTKLGNSVSTNWYNTTAINDGTNQNVIFIPGEAIFSGTTSNQYIEKNFDLSEFANEEVAFRFSFKSDPAETDAGIAIDNFEIVDLADILSVLDKPLNNSISTFPNPTNSRFKLTLDNENVGLMTVQIIDMKGNSILSRTTIKSTKSTELSFDLSNFPSGLYIIKLKINGYSLSTKLIKE